MIFLQQLVFRVFVSCEPREVLVGAMVAEASLDAQRTSTEMTGLTSDDPAVQGPENTQETDDRQQDSNRSKAKHESNKTVPFYKLFSFADYWDCLLMLVGAISAVANGIVMPLMTILIGDAIDAFGGNADNKQEVVHEVSKVIPSSLSFKNQCCETIYQKENMKIVRWVKIRCTVLRFKLSHIFVATG